MPQCLFCRIVAGELPAEIVYQDDLVMAMLDIHPITTGHTQIVSRQHVPYFEDLPEVTASRLIHVGQHLSRAMKSLYAVPRVAFVLTGGDHAHVHAHVVPMHDKTDITSRRYIAQLFGHSKQGSDRARTARRSSTASYSRCAHSSRDLDLKTGQAA